MFESKIVKMDPFLLPLKQQRGKTSDWSIFAGKPPMITNDRDTKREKMT